jgi:hypothetical protein
MKSSYGLPALQEAEGLLDEHYDHLMTVIVVSLLRGVEGDVSAYSEPLKGPVPSAYAEDASSSASSFQPCR